MAKQEKKIEYKETTVFPLFPEYEYTKHEKARLVLFHAYARNIKKIINYAANFDSPNLLCMVYIVGEVTPEKIQTLLASCSDRVCVLTSPFPDSAVATYKEYMALSEVLAKRGQWDSENNTPNAKWQAEYESYEKSKKEISGCRIEMDGQIGFSGFDTIEQFVPDYIQRQIDEHKAQEDIVKRYCQLEQKAPYYFKYWTLHRKGHEPVKFQHSQINRLIKQYYPQGVEAHNINPYAALSPASIDPACEMALTGKPNKRLGFSIDKRTVKAIKNFIAEKIDATGYCKLEELRKFVASPPFGFAFNGYSAAHIAAAVASFDNLLWFDSICDHYAKDSICGLCRGLFDHDVRIARFRTGQVLYREYPCHAKLKSVLAKLYGVQPDLFGSYMVSKCRSRMSAMFRLPCSLSDPLLYQLTSPDLVWYDRAQIETLAEKVDTDKLSVSLECHVSMDKEVPIRERIPDSACWLWDKDFTMENPEFLATREEIEHLHSLCDIPVSLSHECNEEQRRKEKHEAILSYESELKQRCVVRLENLLRMV